MHACRSTLEDPTPSAPVAIDPTSRTVLAIAICVAVFLILCLAMVSVFVDRRFEMLAEREAQSLRAANDRLETTQAAMRGLLDNAEQGFLTVGPDLSVDEQCSAACVAILGRPPAGLSIVDLLCGESAQEDADSLRVTFESLFRDDDDYLRQLKMELLPTDFLIGGRSLRASYKCIQDGARIMVVLTDVTETARLAAEVEQERHRLVRTVLSIRESDTFWSLIADYRSFLAEELPDLARRFETTIPSGEIYRRLHTFKGLLAQFSFLASPRSLHDMETGLSEQDAWTAESAAETFRTDALSESLESDLDGIGQAEEDGSGGANTSPGQLLEFARAARDVLANPGEEFASPLLQGLLRSLAATGMMDVKATLELYSRSVPTLARKLEKRVAPVEVSGEDALLPPERHRGFFRALVHVFRNAVDHGIESPEERIAAGKGAEGRVSCHVRRDRDWVEIEVSDDGRGIDRDALELALAAAGEDPECVRAQSLEDLVFRNGLSSRDNASEVSGRGVGMAAVRHELEQLGGSVTVQSTPGLGARLVFRIADPSAAVDHIPEIRKVAS